MIISNVGNELTSMTENQVADNRKASMNSNGNQLKAKKVRTPKSCDRCKSRKTKVSFNLTIILEAQLTELKVH
jgi:hypothetical protein